MLMTSLEESIQIVGNFAENETDRLLIQTAGKKIVNGSEIVVYRPYYVIGLQLWLSTDNNIKSGEGATFDKNFETSRRNFLMQQMIDLNENLIVPEAFTCAAILTTINSDSVSKSIGFIVI